MVFYNIGWSMAILLAPFMGGMLSEPASKYPEAISRLPEGVGEQLRRFPFLLPNLVAALINVISVVIFVWKLKETRQLEDKKNEHDKLNEEEEK